MRVLLTFFYNRIHYSLGGNDKKNWLPLDFVVKNKTFTFSEFLKHNKKTGHSVEFNFGHLVDFQNQNIMTSNSTVSQISTFPKCNILYINRKIIQYLSTFTKRPMFLRLLLWR